MRHSADPMHRSTAPFRAARADSSTAVIVVLTVRPPLNVAGIVMDLPNAWLLSGPIIYRYGLPLDPSENEEAASSTHGPLSHSQSSHADTPGVDVNQLKAKQEVL